MIVNGRELETDLGTRETWGWPYIGTRDLTRSQHLIELRYLTGFEALYQSQETKAPPDSGDA